MRISSRVQISIFSTILTIIHTDVRPLFQTCINVMSTPGTGTNYWVLPILYIAKWHPHKDILLQVEDYNTSLLNLTLVGHSWGKTWRCTNFVHTNITIYMVNSMPCPRKAFCHWKSNYTSPAFGSHNSLWSPDSRTRTFVPSYIYFFLIKNSQHTLFIKSPYWVHVHLVYGWKI